MEQLLWGPQPAAARRGPRPTLTLDDIARAGIAIADADGLAAVTMQRVAETLGVTKMALYRYVPGKSELVALMIEMGLDAPPPPLGDDWRATLDAWSHSLFARFTAHPWAAEAAVGARLMGPNELGWLETAVAALSGNGLDGSEMLDVAVTLVGHVRSLAQQISAATPPGTEGNTQTNAQGAAQTNAQGAALTDAQGGTHAGAAMEHAIAALVRGREDRFPALAAALVAPATEDGATTDKPDQALDFGLARILDGVSLLIAERTTPPRGRRTR